MDNYIYLLINLIAISIPLMVCLNPRSHFHGKWRSLLPAMALTAIFFISWDVIFTANNIWHFNPQYVIGFYILGLPLEEYLFFICIPFACVFTYDFFNQHAGRNIRVWTQNSKRVNSIAILLLCVVAVIYFNKTYTFTLAVSYALFLLWIRNTEHERHSVMTYLSYLPLLIPFFLINGTLTGAFTTDPVVLYNDAENIGFRLGTIPVEDVFYGLFLIQTNVVLFEYFEFARTRQTITKSSFSNHIIH